MCVCNYTTLHNVNWTEYIYNEDIHCSIVCNSWEMKASYMSITAAAKSLQSCPTLCDPIDVSPPGSPTPGIFQARTLEWVAISFSNAWKWKSESEVAQSCPTLRDPMDCSPPGSSIHGIFQARVLECGATAFCITSSVQFCRSVVSNSLQPHEPQHARPPCASPTPGVHPNPCPLSWWCHPTSSSSVVPFSSCLQSFPASGSFQMSQLFASGGPSIGVSASTSVLSKNSQGWSPLGWTGWISLQSKGLSRVFSNTTVQKHQFLCAQLSLQSNSHIHTWLLEKP